MYSITRIIRNQSKTHDTRIPRTARRATRTTITGVRLNYSEYSVYIHSVCASVRASQSSQTHLPHVAGCIIHFVITDTGDDECAPLMLRKWRKLCTAEIEINGHANTHRHTGVLKYSTAKICAINHDTRTRNTSNIRSRRTCALTRVATRPTE